MAKAKPGYKLVKSFFGKESEIPSDWEYPKFNEVVKTNPITKIEEETVPYIPMDAVDTTKEHFNYFQERKLSDFSSLPKFQENDVLFASITPSTENGKTCIIENFSRKGIGSSELTVLRSTYKVYPKYLYYYVKSHRIRQFAISQMMGSTGRQRVPDYVFKKDLHFELPQFSEQQKIASILSSVDDLISSYNNTIETTKKLKQGLMQTLLTKGIGHKKFKKIKWLFGKEIEIPEEWEVELLDNISKRGSGHTPDAKIPEYYNEGIKWISLADSNKLDNVYILQTEKEISQKGIENSSAIIHPSGTVVLSRDAGIGKSAIITQEMAVSQHFMAWQCGENLDNYFLYYLLQLWKPLFENVANGTTIKTIGLSFFKKFRIFLPSIEEQRIISSTLLNMDNGIWGLESKKTNLETLKKGLMQKLLTGQIRVKV